jgi:hypothetical protein
MAICPLPNHYAIKVLIAASIQHEQEYIVTQTKGPEQLKSGRGGMMRWAHRVPETLYVCGSPPEKF